MKRLLLLLLIIHGMTACHTGEQKIKVGYIQITQDQVLDAAREGLFRALSDSGFVDGQNISILNNNAQGDLSMIHMILQSLITQNADIIVTNSTPCMVAAASTVQNTPVVFTVAFSPEQMGMKNPPDNLAGVYDPLHSEELVELIITCLPGIDCIGIPFNNAEPNAEYAAKILGAALQNAGIRVFTASVTSPNDILMAGEFLAGKKVDALLVAGDNTLYMGLNTLSKVADNHDIPLFVTDPLQVEKGACIGLGVNYDQWGYLSGLKAVEILKGRTPDPAIEPIQPIELIVNLKACKSQGISIPNSLLERAVRIIQ